MTSELLTRTIARMGHVVHLSLERGLVEGEGSGLVLTVRLRDPDNAEDTVVVFSGVAQLKFRGDSVSLTELVLFVVEDISDRGWEHLFYRVTDAEEDFVCFLCRSIEVKSQVS